MDNESKADAIWLYNPSVFPELATMALTVGTGGAAPIWLPGNQVSGASYSTLFGRPLIETTRCQTRDCWGHRTRKPRNCAPAKCSSFLCNCSGGTRQPSVYR